MASRIHGVPLSTTQMAPKAATFQNPTPGIRAPLTLDESDFEYSASSKSRRNSTTSSYYSGSELESDGGFVSGEDESESETDSTRLVVHDPDEVILEETHIVEEYAFSRPVVKNPNGNIVNKSGSNSKIEFLGPPLKIPDREATHESGNGSRNSFSRPYISDFNEYNGSDEETVNEDDYVVNYGIYRPLVSVTNTDVVENAIVGVSSVSISHRPIALISGDSDDDVSEGSVVMEHEAFSGVVRVPSIELLQRINSAPKIRILDLKEDQENESDDENTFEREDNEETILNNGVLGIKHNEQQINVDENVQAELSGKMSQNEGLDFYKELGAKTLVVNGENNCIPDSERNGDLTQINEVKQELDVIDDKRECVDSCISREPTHLFKDTLLNGHIGSVALGEEQGFSCESFGLEIRDTNGGDNFVFDQDVESRNEENKTESESVDGARCSRESAGLKITDTNGGDNFVFDQDFEIRNGENKTESESVDGARCSRESAGLKITDTNGGDNFVFDQDFESRNEENKTESESVDAAIAMEEVPSNDYPRFLEFLETVIESEHVDTIDTVLGTGKSDARQPVLFNTELDQRNNSEAEISEQLLLGAENLMFHSNSVVDEIECEEAPDSTNGGENLWDHLEEIDNKIVRGASEDVETDGGVSDGKKMIESTVKAVSDVHNGKFTSTDGIEVFPLERDYRDLVSMFRSTIPVCEPRNAEFFAPLTSELEKARSEGENENLEQIEQIREKYLWLLRKLGRSCEDFVALELEEQTKTDSDFSLSILVIGKTGVGKSATINSIFGEKKTETNAFGPATESVKETAATVNGLKVKVLDTPGLRTSRVDQSINRKILSSIKKSIKKSPPDVVLYVDRLDMQTCDFTDMPILRLINAYLGSSIWRKSIIVLSHTASLPPDELFVDERSSVIQKMICRVIGDSVYPGKLVPVSLVENDSLHKASKHGEKLLFLCYSMKILLELNSVVATNDSLSSSGLSFMRRGDVISECNLQFQFGVGTNSKLHITAELKEKLSGRVSIRTRGSDQLQIAVLALLLISKALSLNVFP